MVAPTIFFHIFFDKHCFPLRTSLQDMQSDIEKLLFDLVL